jgi:hypothetical protein
MLGATSAAPFPSFLRPRSHASSLACGTISARRGRIPASTEHPRLRIGRAGRDARLRTCGSGGRSRPADDRLLGPYRQLGDRNACRRPVWDFGRPIVLWYSTRASRAAGPSAACVGSGRASPTSRSSTPRLRCGLSPRARVGSPLLAIGAAHFLNRRFNDAVPKPLLAIQADPSLPEPYRFLASCYAHMGRLDDARDIIARLRSITPSVIPNASYLRKPQHRELFLSGLRLAAVEAG